MCSSTLPRLQLHRDDSTSLKGMVATVNPTLTICGIGGTLVLFDLPPTRYDEIADLVLLSSQVLPFNANQFLSPGWRRQ